MEGEFLNGERQEDLASGMRQVCFPHTDLLHITAVQFMIFHIRALGKLWHFLNDFFFDIMTFSPKIILKKHTIRRDVSAL